MTTITIDRATVEQALEALIAAYQGKDGQGQVTEAITALRAALAQQAEPPGSMPQHERLKQMEAQRQAEPVQKQAEPVRVPRGIRMERVDKSTSPHWWSESARIKMPSPELYAAGDAVLCWVNEGDMVMAQQAEPLTIERLRDALVASRIIPPAAVEDPDEYDDGVTLYRIEALHRRLT